MKCCIAHNTLQLSEMWTHCYSVKQTDFVVLLVPGNSLHNIDTGRPLAQDCLAPLIAEHYNITGTHSSSLWLSFFCHHTAWESSGTHLRCAQQHEYVLPRLLEIYWKATEVGTPLYSGHFRRRYIPMVSAFHCSLYLCKYQPTSRKANLEKYHQFVTICIVHSTNAKSNIYSCTLAKVSSCMVWYVAVPDRNRIFCRVFQEHHRVWHAIALNFC